MQTELRQVKRVIYKLKRSQGLPAMVLKVSGDSRNLQTGEYTRTFIQYWIKRVVILPTVQTRSFVFGSGLSSLFREGGHFDQVDRLIIIDRADLAIALTGDEHIQIGTTRYEISSFQETEVARAYMVGLKNLRGANTSAFLGSTSDSLTFSEIALGVKS